MSRNIINILIEIVIWAAMVYGLIIKETELVMALGFNLIWMTLRHIQMEETTENE